MATAPVLVRPLTIVSTASAHAGARWPRRDPPLQPRGSAARWLSDTQEPPTLDPSVDREVTPGLHVGRYNIVVIGAAEAGRWEEALKLVRVEMPKFGVTPDVVSFNAAISACAKAGRWEEAVELLEVDMPKLGVTPDVRSFLGAVTACEVADQTPMSVKLMEDVTKAGLEKELMEYMETAQAEIESK